MGPSDPVTIWSLVALNGAVYATAFAGFVRSRRNAFRTDDPSRVFPMLEKSLKKSFPALPDGYTWREAMRMIEKLDLNVDWAEVEQALKQYEGWRYGEMLKPDEVNSEVVRLARELSRRAKKWQP